MPFLVQGHISFTVLAQGKVDKKDIISNIGDITDEQNIDSLQKANEQLRNRIENLEIEKGIIASNDTEHER